MRVLFIANFSLVEPLGLLYLAGIAKKLGHTSKILMVKNYDFSLIERTVAEFKPDLVGFNIYTGSHKQFLSFSQKIRERGVVTVVGGPHPTHFSDSCLPYADYVVKGEGFASFHKILDSRVVPGIIFSQEMLSEGFPTPDRETFYADSPAHRNSRIKSSITSMGCPYTCSYCYNSSYNKLYGGFKLKLRPIDDVISELKEIKDRWPCEMIYFQDDVLGFDLNWLADFANRYREEVGIPWHAQIRLELTRDSKRLKLFKEAGCLGITTAIESADPWIRNSLMKRKMPNELIYDGCRKIKAAGLKLRTEQMLGVPCGDLGVDLKTLEMNVKIKPDIAWASIFAPYRGTALGEFCVREGYYNGNNDDLGDSFFSRSTLNFYHNDRGWIQNEKAQRQRVPFSKTENERYKGKMIILQNLFNYFAYLPKGHVVANEFIAKEDFTFKTLGDITEKHLMTNGYSREKLEDMRRSLWLSIKYQTGTNNDFELIPHYFTMLPHGDRLAKEFLVRQVKTFKDLSDITRRHLYDEVLYKIY
ncbi:MAG: B12-binding domain-containing radical SAM protein [Patescibacteria group bacterium]|nr:B12-binding domain-containing radical SAM protein [Patescibacteria group bacterium]